VPAGGAASELGAGGGDPVCDFARQHRPAEARASGQADTRLVISLTAMMMDRNEPDCPTDSGPWHPWLARSLGPVELPCEASCLIYHA
jgi:hypothetical protein